MANREKQRANRRAKAASTYYERTGRNAEGYADPTFYQAVKRVERKPRRTPPKTRVWRADN